jgi:hypothetical protein
MNGSAEMSSKDLEYYKEQNIEYQRRIIELQETVMKLEGYVDTLQEKLAEHIDYFEEIQQRELEEEQR